jgi:hypothetical protein
VTAAPTAPATARQGGAWLGKCQNAGDGGDGNTQTRCDADGFHTDLLLLVTADMAAQGTAHGAASWCYFRPRMKSSLTGARRQAGLGWYSRKLNYISPLRD